MIFEGRLLSTDKLKEEIPMSSQPIAIIPTPALERAGLRLEHAASAFYAYCKRAPTGDDGTDEAEFRRVELPYLEARRAFRAMIELITGESADVLERRLSC